MHPSENSYSNWMLYHNQTGSNIHGNMAYALGYLGSSGGAGNNYRGDSTSNSFFPASYGTTATQSYTVYCMPVNGTVQFNRDGGSFSSMTFMEIKQ
jgi:hypothetical protein